jgi:hypothetical protein
MEIVFPDEETCVFSDEDGGTTCNVSEDIVLLLNVDGVELKEVFRDFQRDLRAAFLELFSMESETYFQRYGNLGFRESERESRRGQLFGAMYRGRDYPRLINLRSKAVTKVLADMKQVKRSGRPDERAAIVLSRLSVDLQKEVFRRIVEEPFDDFLNLDSTADTSLEEVELAVAKCKTGTDLLRRIVEELNDFVEVTAKSGARTRYVKYGWAWFAQYADSELKPAGIPINYRPPFRFEAGHDSNQLSAGFRL